MWVKICANTNLEDALLAVELGADAVGFVFAKSQRQVMVEEVAAITAGLKAGVGEGVERVGVFTSTDAEEILAAVRGAGLTAVQLHSAFDPRLVDAIHAGCREALKVVQVVDVPVGMRAEELGERLREALGQSGVFAVLLDASHGGMSGGTGKTFDWGQMAEVVRSVQSEDGRGDGGRVIVAGGLRAENVGTAIATFAPWGVDVASGVEAMPGKKDAERLRRFLEAARGA